MPTTHPDPMTTPTPTPTHSEDGLILGIESSCDETATALVARDGRVHASAVASQVDLHARFGGVVPEVAARMHIQACLPLVEQALAEAGADWDRIEGIAVTYGPGLVGCLLVGLETAKTLAWLHGKPLHAVNHLAGHLYGPFVTPLRGAHLLVEAGESHAALPLPATAANASTSAAYAPPDGEPPRVARPEYPHVGLVVSGGHTSLVWVEGPEQTETLAETVDDAAGEAYDKVARVAGLGYPGGPIVDRLAAEGDAEACPFTVPMARRDRPNFSFSGLKTAAGREAVRLLEAHGGAIPETELRNLCAGFQRAAVESLLGKAFDAVRARGARDLLVTGGVACNRGLRRRAQELTRGRRGLRVWFPHPSLCTDNAAMIAALGWHVTPLAAEAALALNADASLGL